MEHRIALSKVTFAGNRHIPVRLGGSQVTFSMNIGQTLQILLDDNLIYITLTYPGLFLCSSDDTKSEFRVKRQSSGVICANACKQLFVSLDPGVIKDNFVETLPHALSAI